MADNVTLNEYANRVLDASYRKTAGPMLKRIDTLGNSRSLAMQKALTELDAEAAQLEKDGQPIAPDNTALEKAQNRLRDLFLLTGGLIVANALAIQESGQKIAVPAVTAKIFAQVAGKVAGNPVSPAAIPYYIAALDKLGIDWNIPTALDFATGYVDTPAWVARMNTWGSGYADLTRDTLLQGIQNGWGPKYTAAQIRKYAENLPKSAAENLTRTLQLTSYRDASLAMEQLNGGFIIEKVRIATLRPGCCLACIALHGTILQKGERVDDHFRGKCDVWYRTYGGPLWPDTMQADSTPGKRRFVPWQTGEDWFNSLPESRQKQQASFTKSPAKWAAFRAGNPLSVFVGERQDNVFGRQVVESSLVKALGDNAAQFKKLEK